jgi:GTPase
MYETINDRLKSDFYQNNDLKDITAAFEQKVLEQEMSSFVAARELLENYYQSKKTNK